MVILVGFKKLPISSRSPNLTWVLLPRSSVMTIVVRIVHTELYRSGTSPNQIERYQLVSYVQSRTYPPCPRTNNVVASCNSGRRTGRQKKRDCRCIAPSPRRVYGFGSVNTPVGGGGEGVTDHQTYYGGELQQPAGARPRPISGEEESVGESLITLFSPLSPPHHTTSNLWPTPQ